MSPEDITKLLDELTQRFGPSVEHLYGLAVKQATIEGILTLIFGFLMVVVPIVVFLVWVKWYKQKDSYDEGFVIFVASIPVVLGVSLGLIFFYNGLLWLLNPEWKALEILSGLLPK